MAEEIMKSIKELLKIRGFVTRDTMANGNHYRFGLTGLLLKRNITYAWWDWMVTRSKRTYPVESTLLDQSSDRYKVRESLFPGCLRHYMDVSSLVNKTLPFTMIQTGTICPTLHNHHKHHFLFDSEVQTELLSMSFSNPSLSSQSFDQCVSRRLHWWRNFSEDPGRFTGSDLVTLDGGKVKVDITYTFPWGLESVESITNYGNEPLEVLQNSSQEELMCKAGKKKVLPHVIGSSMALERSMLAFILDAYSVYQQLTEENTRVKLQFHNSLAPYVVSIATDEQLAGDMKVIVDHISEEVRKAGISMLDINSDHSSLEEQCQRNDEMGIPFTVILNNATKVDGRIAIRHLDTAHEEYIHITELTSFLQKQMKHIENR